MKELVLNGAILIDVRTEVEYKEEKLENSVNIPLPIENQTEKLPKDKNQNIIVYCKSGKRSNQAANTLIEIGYKNIYDLGSINNCK